MSALTSLIADLLKPYRSDLTKTNSAGGADQCLIEPGFLLKDAGKVGSVDPEAPSDSPDCFAEIGVAQVSLRSFGKKIFYVFADFRSAPRQLRITVFIEKKAVTNMGSRDPALRAGIVACGCWGRPFAGERGEDYRKECRQPGKYLYFQKVIPPLRDLSDWVTHASE